MAGFWRKFAAIAKIVGPAILSVTPGVPAVLIPVIVHGISEAEAIPGASGADKKKHAIAIVKDSLSAVNAAGGAVGDPVEIAGAVEQGVDAVVTAVNAVKAAHPEGEQVHD